MFRRESPDDAWLTWMIEALRAGELSFHIGRVNGTIEKERILWREGAAAPEQKENIFLHRRERKRIRGEDFFQEVFHHCGGREEWWRLRKDEGERIKKKERTSEAVIFREKRSDQSGWGKVRLRFLEGREKSSREKRKRVWEKDSGTGREGRFGDEVSWFWEEKRVEDSKTGRAPLRRKGKKAATPEKFREARLHLEGHNNNQIRLCFHELQFTEWSFLKKNYCPRNPRSG